MKRSVFLLLVLAGCAKDKEPVKAEPAAATATASATASAAATASVDASAVLAAIGDAGLTPREGNDLAKTLAKLDAPCHSMPVSVAQCLAENRPCPDCTTAAKLAAIGVRAGWPETYVTMAYEDRFDPSKRRDIAVDGSPTKGPATAPVTIVEFGSYVCPHCAAEAPKLDALLKAHPKDVRLVFKPAWSPSNPDTERASRAAVSAGAQGKFWEMHALLFANQPKFDASDLDGYAKELGLDVKKFHDDLQMPETTDRLAKDLVAAREAHIDALPAIWINGRPFESFEDLETRIAFEIEASKTAPVAKKK